MQLIFLVINECVPLLILKVSLGIRQSFALLLCLSSCGNHGGYSLNFFPMRNIHCDVLISWSCSGESSLSSSSSSSSSSISLPRGSLGHHKWFHNHFPPFLSVLHCPLGLGELQACPFPDVVSPPLLLSALSSPTPPPRVIGSPKPSISKRTHMGTPSRQRVRHAGRPFASFCSVCFRNNHSVRRTVCERQCHCGWAGFTVLFSVVNMSSATPDLS